MNILPASEKLPLLVVAAVIIEEKRVLITRRPTHKPHGGQWEFPGGKLEPGESPTSALLREINEEIAVKIDVGQILDVLFHRYPRGSVLILAYHCSRTEGTPRNIEVAEHRWVPITELHHYDFLVADKPLIAKLQSR